MNPMTNSMPLSSYITLCLLKYGELSSQELAKKLNVPTRAIGRALGHMRRKGTVHLVLSDRSKSSCGYVPKNKPKKWSLQKS